MAVLRLPVFDFLLARRGSLHVLGQLPPRGGTQDLVLRLDTWLPLNCVFRYGIPSIHAEAFEDHVTSSVSTRSMKADILNRLTKMVFPGDVPEDISVYKAVQQPGDMILTFPRAFHGGYNQGWNCAEAVNFATMDWIMFGQTAAQRYRLPDCLKTSLFSHDRLLWILMDRDTDEFGKDGIPTELKQAVRDAVRVEKKSRREIRSSLFNVVNSVPKKRWDINTPLTCAQCDEHVFFSYVFCGCRFVLRSENDWMFGFRAIDGELLCLRDALQPDMFSCGCRPYLGTEVTDDELETMLMLIESVTDESDD